MARALIPYIAVAREREKTIFFCTMTEKVAVSMERESRVLTPLGAVDIALEIKRDGPEDSSRRLLRGWGRLVNAQAYL